MEQWELRELKALKELKELKVLAMVLAPKEHTHNLVGYEFGNNES